MSNRPINHLTMKEIGEVYNEVFDHCFENVSPTHMEKVATFWLHIVSNQKPYMMVTEQGVADLTKSVFSDQILTDFVVTLTTSFFLRWAPSVEEKESLIELTASALSVHMGGMEKFVAEYRAVPQRVGGRFSTPTDIRSLLTANAWLLVLVLAPQYMTLKDLLPDEEEKPRKPAKQETIMVG